MCGPKTAIVSSKDLGSSWLTSDHIRQDQRKALHQLALIATEFADMAVRSMEIARKELVKRKEKGTEEYKRLVDIMKGRY